MYPPSAALPIIVMMLVLLLSVIPAQHLPRIDAPFIAIDKAVHGTFYASITLLWHWVWRVRSGSNFRVRWAIFTLLLAFFYGTFIECVQALFITNRHFEWADVAANLVGSGGANAWLFWKFAGR